EPSAGEDVSPNSPNRNNQAAHRQSEHDSEPPLHHTIHEEVDRHFEEYERNRIANCIGKAAFPKRDAERVEKPWNGDRHEDEAANDLADSPSHSETSIPPYRHIRVVSEEGPSRLAHSLSIRFAESVSYHHLIFARLPLDR